MPFPVDMRVVGFFFGGGLNPARCSTGVLVGGGGG